jgi:hypothetical protein
MTKYHFVDSHADVLSSGQPVAPGDVVDLSDNDLKQPHNASLLEDGKLVLSEDQNGKGKPSKPAKGEES